LENKSAVSLSAITAGHLVRGHGRFHHCPFPGAEQGGAAPAKANGTTEAKNQKKRKNKN